MSQASAFAKVDFLLNKSAAIHALEGFNLCFQLALLQMMIHRLLSRFFSRARLLGLTHICRTAVVCEVAHHIDLETDS